ncbi:MAG: hypothetical protein Q8S17_14965, partial [Humidesulfovibrio sp.]|nr:hypothetical protein [Humidesulfovibrio sp.]
LPWQGFIINAENPRRWLPLPWPPGRKRRRCQAQAVKDRSTVAAVDILGLFYAALVMDGGAGWL